MTAENAAVVDAIGVDMLLNYFCAPSEKFNAKNVKEEFVKVNLPLPMVH